MHFQKGQGFEKEILIGNGRIKITRFFNQGWSLDSVREYSLYSNPKKYFRIRKVVEYYNVYLESARYYIPHNSGG